MNQQYEKFLRNEFQTLSILGAFGRGKVYPENEIKKGKDARHNEVNKDVRERLDLLATQYETSCASDYIHCTNISKLTDGLTHHFGNYFRDQQFRIGIAQKLINLYLKYLWCIDVIPEPPHCPFDNKVLDQLPGFKTVNWTQITDINTYEKIVNAARVEAKKQNKSLSQWELDLWSK